MTGPNHLVGGAVYTGVFCSFWDVNIFSKPWYLVACLLFSLLPDIDHKQGILGRSLAFTQIPQYIERNYGHRTITHSLICYFGLGLLVLCCESMLSDEKPFTLIFFLAYSSHLIFDMMTVSGVPLLFPFKKNPCVLPANPEFRLKVKDTKSEMFIFMCFIGIGFFCYPLMVQGFWTSYNRSFGTLEHLNREYSQSLDLLNVTYNYSHKGEEKNGSALLVHCESSKAFLFDSNQVFELNKDMNIKEVLPTHTAIKREEKQYYFYSISEDSLKRLIDGKVILSAEFQSNKTCGYWESKTYQESQVIKLNYSFNPTFQVVEDTSHTNERKQLEIKLIELKEKQQAKSREIITFKAISREFEQLNSLYPSLSLPEQESSLKRLKTLQSKKENYSFSEETNAKLLKQIEQLENEINKSENLVFTGSVVTLQ